MPPHSPMAIVVIALAVAIGTIVVVDMVVLPAMQAEAGCHHNVHNNRDVGTPPCPPPPNGSIH